MGDSSLQDRLRDHAKAFDGLLSLIPAKMYYGEDRNDQWSKEKQTKREAAAARRAKLDPDSALNRNAKEVMDERAEKKRRLQQHQKEEEEEEEEEEDEEEKEEEEEEEEDDDEEEQEEEETRDGGEADRGEDEEAYEPLEGLEAEKPREGLRSKEPKSRSKSGDKEHNDNGGEDEKGEEGEEEDDEKGEVANADADASATPKLSRKEQKRAAKREKKAEKRAEKKAKIAAGEMQPVTKKDPQASKDVATAAAMTTTTTTTPKKSKATKASKDKIAPASTGSKADKEDDASPDVQMEDTEPTSTGRLHGSLDVSALANQEEESATSALESEPQSPTFDTNMQHEGSAHHPHAGSSSAEAASTTTSTSSAVPPSEKPKHIKIPADTTALRARLAAKIEALRAARKADGPDGKPIRTRQELIEARRAKELQRKEHKKELRRVAKLEEARKREEALASNSPGVMSPGGLDSSAGGGNFSFGRVAFADGAQMSHELSYFLNRDKKRGPSDPKTALLKVQNQKKRLEELDEAKRKDAADKETWLTARRRLEGDKIRDDEALLKKAVKRKETAKKKSEKAWKERATGVAQAQRERQKRREENIKQRREDKLLKRAGGGKKKKGGAAGAGGGKKKKGGRPGFEGSLGVGGRK